MSNDELIHLTPEYMLLPKIKFKLSLMEYRYDEDLKNSFLDIVIRNDMSQYYEDTCNEFHWEVDRDLLEKMQRENAIKYHEFEAPTDTNMVDYREPRWRQKLEYAFKIGDCEKARSIALNVFENTSNLSSNRAEAAFTLFRVAYFKNDVTDMERTILSLSNLMDSSCNTGSDWCCRNKLKVYESLYCLATRNFSKAAALLLETIPTFESYELLPFKNVIEYTVIAAMLSLSRSELSEQLNNGILQQTLITESPKYKEYFSTFYHCHYSEFLNNLAWLELQMKLDPLLHSHYRYYTREMRIKAYSQLLQAYRTLSLTRMAAEFALTEEYIEQELSRFIFDGRLRCKVDKVSGNIITVSAAGCNKARPPDACCERGFTYQNVIRKGDSLLNRLKKLRRVNNL